MTKKGSQRKGKAARTVKAAERRLEALALRREGMGYQEIADALGVALGTAWGYVRAALDDINEASKETAKEIREIELQRLDEMQAAIWPMTKEHHEDIVNEHTGEVRRVQRKPNLKAAHQVLGIMTRRARLLGLDEPERVEVSLNGEAESARSKILARMAQKSPKK